MYWEIFTKVHAAVPVSQLFFVRRGILHPYRLHLGVYIRLGTMDLADILNVCGTGLTVDFKGSVTSAQNSFCDGYPGIVVAEDTGILLVSGDEDRFTKFEVRVPNVAGDQGQKMALSVATSLTTLGSAIR